MTPERAFSILRSVVFVILSAVACSDGGRGNPDDTETEDSGGDTDADTDTGSDSDAGADGGTDTDTGAFDCADVPSAPMSIEQVDTAVGSYDVAFDSEGFLVGSDGNSLFKTSSNGNVGVYVSGLGSVYGMDYLPGGDLIAASGSQGLARITPFGTYTSIAPGLSSVYGVTVGPDGKVYAADGNALFRVDPDTCETETLIPSMGVRVVDFSPDLEKMYVGNMNGDIYIADLDDDFDIVGSPTVFVSAAEGCPIDMGAIGVDVCGNLYVECHHDLKLLRVTPDGVVSIYHTWSEEYVHGFEWGSGVDGWDDRSIYMPQPYTGNYGVLRMEIGVPYRE